MKKIISVLLTICFLFSCLPLMAAAYNITPETSFEDFANQLCALQEEYDSSYVGDISFEDGSEFYRISGETFPVENEQGDIFTAEVSEGNLQIPIDILDRNSAENENKGEDANNSLTFESENTIEPIEYAEKLGYEIEFDNNTAVLSQPYQNHRLIVKSKYNINPLDSVAIVEGYNDLHIVQFDSIESTLSALEYYENKSGIKYVEPDIVLSTEEYENLENSSSTNSVIAKPYANHLSWGSEAIGVDDYIDYLNDVDTLPEIVVGIIDTGIDLDHDLLKNRIIRTNCNLSSSGLNISEDDDEGHGTHVAGIIADNSTENVKLKGYKALNANGSGSLSNIVLCIDKAVQDGVNVINMSLGARGYSYIMEEFISNAISNGVIVCVSAGNDGENAAYYTPAGIKDCITVAAFGQNDHKPIWTNYGSIVDITAPGVGIFSTFKNNGYTTLSGTSMAAPFVSAASALILSKNPNLGADEVSDLIKANGRKCADSYYDKNMQNTKALFIGNMIVDSRERTATPILSVPSGKYTDGVTLEISCPENASIYYTLDGSRATKENGILYTGPIYINSLTRIHAIAIAEGKITSLQAYADYYIVTKDPESNFEIDTDGLITAYSGNNNYLIIPKTINSITVTGIGDEVFYSSPVKLSLSIVECPDTLTYVGNNAFSDCSNLSLFECKNLTAVGNFAFNNCSELEKIDLSNLENVGSYAFFNCHKISELKNEKLTSVTKYAFCSLTHAVGIDLPNVITVEYGGFACLFDAETINLPKVQQLGGRAFAMCTKVQHLEFPSLSHLDADGYQFAYCDNLKELLIPNVVSSLPECVIYDSPVKELRLNYCTNLSPYALNFATSLETLYAPNLKTVNTNSLYETNSLKYLFIPNVTTLSDYPRYKETEIYLTSALKSATSTLDYYQYKVYAPKNSYAQAWCNDDGHTFIDSYSMAQALGATIRLSDCGMRFGFSFEDMEFLKAKAKTIEYGFYFDTTEYDNLYNYKSAKNTIYNSETKCTSFNLVILNIPKSEFKTTISARAYVNIDGMIFMSPIVRRNFSYVGNMVLADSSVDEGTKAALRTLLQ